MKRFKHEPWNNGFLDSLTGKHYTETDMCKSTVCDLCNDINDRADMNAEISFELSEEYNILKKECMKLVKSNLDLLSSYVEYWTVLEKYNIDSPEKLDKVLMNERVW